MIIDPTSTQTLISAGMPLVGGGLLGFSVGWALRKIMKLAFTGLGLLALLLGYLESQKWINVNWTVVENETSTMMTHAANKIAAVTQHMNHEIPIGFGVVDFIPGFAAGLLKG